jgi:hypothetical protein
VSKFLYIELQVREEVVDSIAERFTEITNLFELAAKSEEYDGVVLTLTTFVASTERAIIKVSDVYLRNWTDSMKKAIRTAWWNIADLLKNEEFGIGTPTLIFSTILPE